mmetsp:Transcript_16373/g.45669  ORF Transcript_16373/g.45669 Transcript_16373/m.45669 type:complete len:247 (+) Transcript_16373:1096-1836(+)
MLRLILLQPRTNIQTEATSNSRSKRQHRRTRKVVRRIGMPYSNNNLDYRRRSSKRHMKPLPCLKRIRNAKVLQQRLLPCMTIITAAIPHCYHHPATHPILCKTTATAATKSDERAENRFRKSKNSWTHIRSMMSSLVVVEDPIIMRGTNSIDSSLRIRKRIIGHATSIRRRKSPNRLSIRSMAVVDGFWNWTRKRSVGSSLRNSRPGARRDRHCERTIRKKRARPSERSTRWARRVLRRHRRRRVG